MGLKKIIKKIKQRIKKPKEKEIKKPKEYLKKPKERNPVLEKIQKEIYEERRILENKFGDFEGTRMNARAAFLAQEALVTETFVNRLRRESNRPIVVIGNGGTGEPYTWSIKQGNDIFVEHTNYPSTRIKITPYTFKEVTDVIEKYKHLKPIYVFVDASKQRRMPSSFAGYRDETYTQKNESLYYKLKQIKLRTVFVGYDWSLKNKVRYLPHLEEINKGKIDVILFNPTKDRKFFTKYEYSWNPAAHDDYQYTPDIKRLTLLYTKLYKETYLK